MQAASQRPQHYSPESSIWKLLGLKMNLHAPEPSLRAVVPRTGVRALRPRRERRQGRGGDAGAGRQEPHAGFPRAERAGRRELHPWACSVNIHDEPLARAPNQSRSLLDYLGVDKGSALYPAAPRLNLKYEEIPYVSKHEARRADDATRCRRPPSDAASNISDGHDPRTSVRAWACTTGYVC